MRALNAMAAMLIALPAGAPAQPVTGEAAVERGRRAVMGPPAPGRDPCRTGSEAPEIIVVCGSNAERERQRMPPSVPAPGDVDLLDPRGASPGFGCLRLCPQPVTINLLTVGLGTGPRNRTRTAIDEIREALGAGPE